MLLSTMCIFLYWYCVDRDRNSAVNGDMVNGELVSGEQTPSSDADSLTLDTSADGDTSRVCRQDIITITGRRENCEAARDAMLVCTEADNQQQCMLFYYQPLYLENVNEKL